MSINLYNFYKWGLWRSPKQGEGGSPTLSHFPGERGLGIGIEDKHFFEKNILFSTDCYPLRKSGGDFCVIYGLNPEDYIPSSAFSSAVSPEAYT